MVIATPQLEVINSHFINYNPCLILPETSLSEIIKKFAQGNNYLIVAKHNIHLGVITAKNLIKIINLEVDFSTITAENIYQEFPFQPQSEKIDVYIIANNIYQNKYPIYGLVDTQGYLQGIITPESLCLYLANDSFYQQIKVNNFTQDNLLIAENDDLLIDLIAIINSYPDKKGFILGNKDCLEIITYKDIFSGLLKPNWQTLKAQNINNNQSENSLFNDHEILAKIGRKMAEQNWVIISNYQRQPDKKIKQLEFDYNGYSSLSLAPQLSLITPEELLIVFHHQWQHNYLQKQQEELNKLKKAVKHEKKQVSQEKLLTQLSYRIRKSLNLDTILNSTVEEVRQYLECDRVITYQLYPDGEGIIIAESIQQDIMSIKGRKIKDHCFAEDFIQPYLNGRIQATDNIFHDHLSPCHIKLLQDIQVQANLVVPIIFHDQLWGLLAAQNCTKPRKWEEEELDLLQKLASQVAIAIQQSEYAEKALEVADYQSAIALLGSTALMTDEVEPLIQNAVETIAKTLQVKYCCFMELQANQAAFVVKAAVGWEDKWLGIAKMSSSSRWMPGYTLKVLQPVVSEDLPIESRFSPPPFLHNQGIVSGATVAVGRENICFGIIGIYSLTHRKFNVDQINFLQTVSNVLATAIERTKSQKQLDYFFHLSLDMFCIANVDGILQRINSSFLVTLGYAEEEMVNENMLKFIHPDDEKITRQELVKLSRGFSSVNFENRWRTSDGLYRWLAWKSLPYEEGFIYATARDITLAKQAEAQLRSLNEELESRVKNRTEELERASTQLRTFVQTAGTVLVVLDQEYNILEWNEEAEKIFGWKRNTVLGEDFFLLFIPPDDRNSLQGKLNITLKQGIVQRNLESKIMVADGSERTLLWNINRFTNGKGEGIGVIACGQDIEEVRIAQLRLKLSEERFRSIFNQAAVGIMQVSLPGKLILVNDKFVQLTGYNRQQLGELDFPQLIHPDDVSPTLTDLSDLLGSQKATFEREVRIMCGNGNFLWISLTMSVVWVSVEPSYFIAVVNDISDRKQAEESLQKSESRLNSVLSSLQDVVWSVSLPELKYRYINPACKSVYGYSSREILGNPNLIKKLPVGEYQQIVQNNWHKIVESYQTGELQSRDHNKTWELEYQIQLPTGEYKWIRERSHLVYDEYNRAVSIDGITTDVTQRHQAEEKLYKSLQEKEVLLKEIHHRVKNNLYVISGLLNLQSSYVEDEAVKNLFYDSQNRIQTMAVIHEQLYQSDDLSEINFADYVKRLVDNLFLSHSQNHHEIKSVINLENCFLNIETAIPAGLLVNELITNSFKHAFPDNQGQVTIKLQSAKSNQIKLEIKDNGKGFPPDLNWQESPSLGLRLVRLLAQQLDAEITVNSDENGTCFSLEFSPMIS